MVNRVNRRLLQEEKSGNILIPARWILLQFWLWLFYSSQTWVPHCKCPNRKSHPAFTITVPPPSYFWLCLSRLPLLETFGLCSPAEWYRTIRLWGPPAQFCLIKLTFHLGNFTCTICGIVCAKKWHLGSGLTLHPWPNKWPLLQRYYYEKTGLKAVGKGNVTWSPLARFLISIHSLDFLIAFSLRRNIANV